jgi:hypothetical protein
MTDEWKAPAKASADDGDEKSWKLLEKTCWPVCRSSVARGAGGFSSSC